ncbi:MAG: class I SAM-dependent methyltransferase, partial [Bacteroidales bacterium]|nr:class I SAM-dependent methyltransferase [Bacteroidales bacterium]
MTITDPYEKALWDYFKEKEKTFLVIHSNKGDDETVPVKYFFRTFDEMPDIEKKALTLCYGKVLDIGAGSGCHSLFLQDKMFDVTALDFRLGLTNLMKERGLKKVICEDIFKYQSEKFDTLLMLMNGIGLVGDLKGLSRFLKHSRNLLNKGGQILLDSSDLMFMYQEEDDSVKINLNEGYYGEVEYRFEYNGIKGEPFKWLFVDF